MRLSHYAKMQVPRSDFWKAVALAVVLVSGIGIFQGQPAPFLHIASWFSERWLWGGAILLLWAVALFQRFRSRGQSLPRQQVVFLMGYTLFAGSHLLPHSSAAASWLSNIGCLVIMACILLPFVDLSKRDEETSSAPHSDSAL